MKGTKEGEKSFDEILNEGDARKTKQKKAVNFRLSVFAAGALILGILFAEKLLTGRAVIAAIVAIVTAAFLILCAVSLIFNIEKGKLVKNILFAAFFAGIFALGAAGFYAQYKNFSKKDLGGHYYTITGNVRSKTEDDYFSLLEITNVSVKGVFNGKIGYGVALSVSGEASPEIGDEITFTAFITEYSAVYDGELAASRMAEGFKYRAEVSASEIISVKNSPNIFQRVNLFIKDALKAGLGEKEFGVAYAMLTGGSEHVEEGILSAYRDVGIAHIFAVSGLHIGFFTAALGWLLKKCRVKPVIRAVFVITSAFFYSGVCGFSSSSLRAAIMCSAAYFAVLSGERYDGLSALGIAAAIILLLNPAELFTAGFELSFITVAGLLILARPLFGLLCKIMPAKLAKAFSAVISAFAFSFPVLLRFFGKISFTSILANLIFIPVVGALYVALFALTIVAGIFGANGVFLFLPNIALKAINVAAGALQSVALIVSGTAFGAYAAFYYASAITASGMINLKRVPRAVVSAFLAAVFLAGTAVYHSGRVNAAEAYLSGNGKVSAAIIKEGRENFLIITGNAKNFSPAPIFRAAEKKGIDNLKTVYILSGGANGDFADAHAVLTMLSHGFAIEKIVWCKTEEAFDESLKTVIEKSFSGVKAEAIACGDIVKDGKISFSFAAGGAAAEIFTEEFSAAVIGMLGENAEGCEELKSEYDFVVCSDYAESISALCDYKEFYSFFYSERFTNVISSGIISLRF